MFFTDLTAALQTLPSPTDIFPGLSVQGAWTEFARLVGLWCGLTLGISLCVMGIVCGCRIPD